MQGKNWIIKWMLSFIVLILLIKVCWKIGPGEGILLEKVENKMDVLPSFITYEVGNNETLTQTFAPSYGFIDQINILLLQVGGDRAGALDIRLNDAAGNIVWEEAYQIADLKAGEWFPIKVGTRIPANKLASLTFSVQNVQEPVIFTVANRALDTEENLSLYNTVGEEVAGGLLLTFNYQATLRKTTKLIYCALAVEIAVVLLLCIWLEHPLRFLRQLCYDKEGKLKVATYLAGWLVIAGVFAFTHIYRLFDTPYGLNIDEIGMGYDAWSLANFGVDRYLKQYPVYLINFGGGQSALHAYLVAALIKIFGYSEKLFRMPALLNALVMLTVGSLLIRKRWKNRTTVLLFAILFSIFPVFTMFTRFGFDCNLMMGMSTLLIWGLIVAAEKQQTKFFALAGLLAGITLYTYVISYMIVPLFLVSILVYLIWTRKVSLKQVIAFAVPFILLAIPLLLEQLVNMLKLPEMHLGFITIPRMLQYRAKELSLENYWSNLYDTLRCTFWYDMWNYDTLPDYKVMYWFSVPFSIIGIFNACANTYEAIKERRFHIDTVLSTYFFCVFFTGGLLDGGSGVTCYKINSIYMPLLFFVVQGMITLYDKLKNEAWLTPAVGLLISVYIISFGQFTDYYYGKEYHDGMIPSVFFEHTYSDTIAEIQRLGFENCDRKIIVATNHSALIHFFASKMISPIEQPYEKGLASYQNYYFNDVEESEIDITNVYILTENDKKFAIELEKNGMLVEKIGTRYLCY